MFLQCILLYSSNLHLLMYFLRPYSNRETCIDTWCLNLDPVEYLMMLWFETTALLNKGPVGYQQAVDGFQHMLEIRTCSPHSHPTDAHSGG